MHFKLPLKLTHLFFSDDTTVDLHSPDNSVRMTLNHVQKGKQTTCDLFCEHALGKGQQAHFDAWQQRYDEWAGGKPLDAAFIHPPQALRDLYESLESRMMDFFRTASNVFLWRLSMTASSQLVSETLSLQWSSDGQEWKPFRKVLSHIAAQGFLVGPRMDDIQHVQPLLDAGTTAPVAHELLREARTVIHSSVRSALIIGMTAAEVGVKTTIAQLVPEARWLAMNAPTPPLVAMLDEYLPTLPVKATFKKGAPAFIPPILKDALKKGVTMRNEATHQGARVEFSKVVNLLDAVEDLLQILDVYMGHIWPRHFKTDASEQMRIHKGEDQGATNS